MRNYVDEHIGIDYSLLRDPVVSTDSLDLDFKVNADHALLSLSVPVGVAVPACTPGITE